MVVAGASAAEALPAAAPNRCALTIVASRNCGFVPCGAAADNGIALAGGGASGPLKARVRMSALSRPSAMIKATASGGAQPWAATRISAKP